MTCFIKQTYKLSKPCWLNHLWIIMIFLSPTLWLEPVSCLFTMQGRQRSPNDELKIWEQFGSELTSRDGLRSAIPALSSPEFPPYHRPNGLRSAIPALSSPEWTSFSYSRLTIARTWTTNLLSWPEVRERAYTVIKETHLYTFQHQRPE